MSECRTKKTSSTNTWWIIGIVVLVVLVLGFFCCSSYRGCSKPCGGCSNPCGQQGCSICGNCPQKCCADKPCGQSSCNQSCCRSQNQCCPESPCKRSSCDNCCSPKDRAWKCLTKKLDQFNSCVGEAAGVPDQIAQCKASFVSDTSCDCGYSDKGCLMVTLQNYQACIAAIPTSTATGTSTSAVTCKTVFQREVDACTGGC